MYFQNQIMVQCIDVLCHAWWNLCFVFLLVVAVLVFLVEMLIWVVGMSFGGCLFVFSSFWFILVGLGLGWIDGMFILVHRSTKNTLGSYKTHKLKIIIPNFLMEGSSRGKEPAEATFPSKLLSGIQFCINPIFLRIWLKLEGYLIKNGAGSSSG